MNLTDILKYAIAGCLLAFAGIAHAEAMDIGAIAIGGATLEEIGLWLVTLVGAASLLSRAITKIVRITPNTKDDELAGKFAKAVGYVQSLLDRLALNPPQPEARK